MGKEEVGLCLMAGRLDSFLALQQWHSTRLLTRASSSIALVVLLRRKPEIYSASTMNGLESFFSYITYEELSGQKLSRYAKYVPKIPYKP